MLFSRLFYVAASRLNSPRFSMMLIRRVGTRCQHDVQSAALANQIRDDNRPLELLFCRVAKSGLEKRALESLQDLINWARVGLLTVAGIEQPNDFAARANYG
jgi:hypothetical protein